MTASRISALLQDDARRAGAVQFSADKTVRIENDRLSVENARLRRQIMDLECAADTDPLVSVYNRRAFMRELSRAQAVHMRYDIPSSLIFFDLNGFKSINDRFGHAIGDELLQKVGQALSQGVRDCDMVARLGGDEFGVLLFKADAAIAKAKAATLSCRISEQVIEHPTGNIGISTAWGVAPCETGNTPRQILSRADRAMYFAKQSYAE